MNSILVIPDIHGRKFWIDATRDISKYDKVIFLGDYLDPYPFENITINDAITNFLEILDFKKENLDKVVLLLGNHDIYYYERIIGNSRYCYDKASDIENIFDENRSLFQLAYETENTLFTHAGYMKEWEHDVMNIAKYNNINIEELMPTAERLNKFLSIIPENNDNDSNVIIPDEIYPLFFISRERGGRNGYGSPIWADVYEHHWSSKKIDKFQVFGHTLQLNTIKYYKTYNIEDICDGNEIITENYAMLDCRHAFEYDEENRKFNKI